MKWENDLLPHLKTSFKWLIIDMQTLIARIYTQAPTTTKHTHTNPAVLAHQIFIEIWTPPIANRSTITSLPHQWDYSSPLKHVFICLMMDSNDFLYCPQHCGNIILSLHLPKHTLCLSLSLSFMSTVITTYLSLIRPLPPPLQSRRELLSIQRGNICINIDNALRLRVKWDYFLQDSWV